MKTSDETPKDTMTTTKKETISPIELQGPQQKLHESQDEPFQMNIDPEDQALNVTEPQHKPSKHQHDHPGYQPRDAILEEAAQKNSGAGTTDYRHSDKQAEVDEHIEVFYDDDTSSETDLQHVNIAEWAESSGNASDAVVQSSDDYGNDMDDIRDDDDDDDEEDDIDDEEEDEDIEDEDENISDDTGDTDELQEIRGKPDYQYKRHIQHGPYLKSRRQVEQLRKSHGRPGALRKRQIKLRTIPSTGGGLETTASLGYVADQNPASEFASSQIEFTQTCEELSRMLQQGHVQQGVELVKGLIEFVIEWRKDGDIPTGCTYTVSQMHLLENTFFGTWAKILLERRPSPNNASIVMFLKNFVRLACLIIQRDNILPELYAQVVIAMFEQGDLEIYKRNPKRPSRLAHVERMARFDEYASEYGPEDDEVPQLQQEFQRLFFTQGGLEICMSAIEYHMGGTEYPDVKLRNLLLLLSLISKIPVAGDFGHSQFSKLSEFSKRLITAVLGYFPDNADNFRSVSKMTVLDIISLVGFFLLENYRMQTIHLHSGDEPDADYEEFSLHDPISRFNLGEVKYADFRLEMAVRLMKTSRLDLRLAGLVELKEVLIRIQRLQQGRSRLRRRSEVDMDLQMDLDRKPIEHLCSKLQTMQIVECIFGSNIHLEIVQRSTDVLVFMVQARVLTIDDIELIWTAVGAVPLGSWDQQLLDLARSIFHAMVQRSKYNPEEGPISLIPYETLLNVLRNSTPSLITKDDPSFGVTPPSNRDVISGIAHLLKEGLGYGPLPQDIPKLIDCCTKDLKSDHPGAIWSLQVVQHIFENQFMNNDKGAAQLYRQTCSALSELYISNIKSYTTAVKAMPPTPSPTVSSFAPLSIHHLSQEYWRGQQLKMRFEFLKAMAKLFPVYWNSPNLAETLWSCFIVDPIGIQEQDEAFQCLEAMTEARFVQYIYEKLLAGLDIATISQKAWQCVRQYFLLLNWHRRFLVATEDPSNEGVQVIVVLAPLYGMDLIWKIALHAQLPSVGAHAIELLSTLIKKQVAQQESSTPEAAYSFREGLVETCVEHLVKSSDHLSDDDTMDMPDVSLVFERCIGILKAFLVACNAERDESASRPEMHGTLDEDAMLSIKVNSGTLLFQVSVHPGSTLSSLKKAVATRLGYEAEEIRLFSLGKDFIAGWDSKTLEELQIENGQSFLATKRPQTLVSTRTVEVTAKRVPTDLLLEPGFFERVRKIFLLDEKYASQAWEVVTRLPTSPVLLHSLATLQEDVDWTTVLDARSPFLLLYSLQIVNSLIKRDQANGDPSKQLWVKRFLLLGGQQHLTTLLMSDSGLGAVGSSPTSRKALGLMLKVLVRLTSSSDIESGMATDSSGLTVPAFLDKLVSEILTSASREGGHSPNDQGIVLNATSLISYLCAGPSGWQYFHKGPDIRALIFVSMVQSDSMQIRQTVLEMGKKFCLQIDAEISETSPVMFFLDIIQSFLPISKEYENNCSELFEFFELIAREAIHYCSDSYFRTLYTRLMDTIINHPSSEDMNMLKEDTILVGMLKVATAMINTDQKLKHLDTSFRIIDYIFDECLFSQSSGVQSMDNPSHSNEAKCKSEGSRSAAFSFLEESARGEADILRHIIQKTRKHFERESEIEDQWGYDPQTIKRAGCGFVGLQNLGATCYVNSIIQQFFMNKDFRSGILDAPISDEGPGKHDTLLYQLQALFGNLQESIRRAYNAHGFCYAYKDWDGNPMNVAVQMDVDEFFNILFDRLENSVKNTPQEELFKQQYGGKLVQQIKSKDCEHISEREDSFFSIQCEVKNKKTLEESLQLYVQGEILDGDNKYKCSSCDKHVDAIKRACIKELPQNLILHLKRFDYDMDTMRRIKINDRFEFPTSLDMEPYTLDYLTRKEQAQDAAAVSPTSSHITGAQENAAAFQYNLVGVLVHTGTADSGHYYSYIKDRTSNAASGQFINSDGNHWYLFNDSKVEEFDSNDIPAKAFGGPEFIPVDSSPYMKSPTRSITKPYSAYMLFYERAERIEANPQNVAPGHIPFDIRDLVVKENTALLRDLCVFDRLYYRFIWSLFNLFRTSPEQIEAEESSDITAEPLDYLSMQYGLDFFFSVLIHARDVDQELQQWTGFLSPLLRQYPKGCAKFVRSLASNQTLLLRVLQLCPITQVREAVIDLIFEALHGLREQDSVEYGLVAVMAIETSALSLELNDDDLCLCSQGSPIHELIQALLQILPEARANWRNFDEYFKLIYNITQLGRAERVLMVREGYISELVEFYISDERGDSKKKKMGDKFTKPSFRYLLLSVQEILTTCDIPRSYEALQSRGREHGASHSATNGHGYRKPSSSASSTSSATSSSNSDEVTPESDTHISSTLPELEQSILLSQADFNALFACYLSPSHGEKSQSLILIAKMIQERIDSAVIARLVTHLSKQEMIGSRLLDSLASYLQYANDEQFSTIVQIFKELVQLTDEHLETRVGIILNQLSTVLEQSPQPMIAYDCLDFFRTIVDYGQCGRFALAWLIQNSRVWLRELLLNQNESDTRLRARLFYMELLSSERAFNGWNDEEAARASAQHFGKLLEMMNSFPDIMAYYPVHLRRDDDSNSCRFVDYFRILGELVKSDTERQMFSNRWILFIDILTKIDAQQLTLDYDKKEMMVFWSKIMSDNQEANTRLANTKSISLLLQKFYVCLQINPANVQFHREILPIYFGLVLRFCKLEPKFHMEWVQCHNYTWAVGSMKWGAFTQHCPEELKQLLQFTLSKLPQYRQECWRMLPTSETQRFLPRFMQMARDMFESENELAGKLFYQNRGLVHLTDAMSSTVTATSDEEFFAIEALTLLYDYICDMTVCRDTQEFAEAMDHWSNIHTAVELLLGNLMWTAPPQVYARSLKILEVIAKEARYTQAEPILIHLDKVHLELRDAFESKSMNQAQVQHMFGGSNSPYCQYGVFEAREALSNVNTPPMRIGPLIFMHPELFGNLGDEGAQHVLQKWFVPYWELARTACSLDGGRDGRSKAIELAALMTIEQTTARSLIHLDVLCEEVVAAVDNEDILLLFQNPYVSLCLERLFKRQVYLDALTKNRLSACAVLLKSSSLEETQLAELVEENFIRAEQVLKISSTPTSSDELQTNEPISGLRLTEENVQALVTVLQNLIILGVDIQEGTKKMDADRLKRLYEGLCSIFPQLPETYKAALLDMFPQLSDPMQDISEVVKADTTEEEETDGSTIAQQKLDNDSSLSTNVEDDTVMMTGVIQAPVTDSLTDASLDSGNGEMNE
ncbi:hypothetical protein BGZ46_005284 [Entomortierella lignicola]|nr:hypothetical protein BGZ46_005284 [Entomortierella lignicola]